MKIILVLAVALAAASAAQLTASEIKRQWAGFKVMHAKTYESAAEEDYRMKIFTENLHRVNAHNARFDKGLETFKVGINKYSDLLTHEVTEKLNGLRIDADKLVRKGSKVHFAAGEDATKDKTVDWRQKGLVTAVKDQGQCGSCWSFSATGALEGQLFKKNGKLVPLSEQNLVDCSTSYGNQGCNGGLMDQAFEYVKDNKGINTEASYPYEAVDGRCRYKAQNSAGTDSGYVDVNPTEKDLQDAVAKVGPVSIAIDASNWSFQNYASGIYYDRSCSSRNLDHGVLAVGYGSSGKNDYWIVKNSWGSSWGEDGYIRIARNKRNHCGVATMASYPTV